MTGATYWAERVRVWSQPFLEGVGLPYLPIHLFSVFRSLLLWYSIQLLSAGVSPMLFPERMRAMSPRKRVQWDMHFVALVHSAIVGPLALYYWLKVDDSTTDMVWGYDYGVGQMYTLSFGYFVWDVVQSFRYESLQFVVHGALALMANVLVYHPFLMFDGMGILIWELSTPFLNIHWFMDKLGMTGSKAQKINAVFLVCAYIGVRLILGPYISFRLIRSVLTPAKLLDRPIPWFGKVVHPFGLVVLNSLNYFWFYKMLKALQKRFTAEPKTG